MQTKKLKIKISKFDLMTSKFQKPKLKKKVIKKELFLHIFKYIKKLYALKYILEKNKPFQKLFYMSKKKAFSFLNLALKTLKNKPQILLFYFKKVCVYLLKTKFLKKIKTSFTKNEFQNFLLKYIQKLYFLIQNVVKQKQRFLKNQSNKKLTNKKQMKAFLGKKKRSYAILKINVSFSNFTFMLTTLTGQILRWINGGRDHKLTKRTRMTSRAVGKVMLVFLKVMKKSRRIQQRKIRFIKVEFVGPSKRYRQKLFKMFRRRCRKLKFRILCQSEAFHRSYNGCRLSRKKR